MKTLLTGCEGQVGRALCARIPPDVTMVRLSRQDLDISDKLAVDRKFSEHEPDLIINCAAFTAVELAQTQTEAAFRVNAAGPAHLADAAMRHHSRLIHLSTDYVFDGNKSSPYTVDDSPNPINEYGRSKLAGELAITERAADNATIIRTSWVYAAVGANFVNAILGKLQNGQDVRVVEDQIGVPTWAASIASAVWAVVADDTVSGILHWTDAGVASWYDLAQAVLEEARALALVNNATQVFPIPSTAYPSSAPRPGFSVLASWNTRELLQLSPRHWRENLRRMLAEKRGA